MSWGSGRGGEQLGEGGGGGGGGGGGLAARAAPVVAGDAVAQAVAGWRGGGSRAGTGPAAMVACGGVGASAGKVARRVGGRVYVLCVLCMGRQRWRDSAKCGGTGLCRVPTIWHTTNMVV